MKFLCLGLAALLTACIGPATSPGFTQKEAAREDLTEKYQIPSPAIIAHRGASYNAPEGTRPAYLLAREMGVDYLELDLQKTRDNVLVIFHDADLKPKTNIEDNFPTRKNCRIADFTWAELQQLEIGSWFNTKYPDRARSSFASSNNPLRLLRLEQVIEMAEASEHQPGLYIELKYPKLLPPEDRQQCGDGLSGSSESFEKVLVGILEKNGWIKSFNPSSGINFARVIFQSFEPDSLARLNKVAPNVPKIFLVDEIMVNEDGWEALIASAKKLGVGIGPWGSSWASDPEWSLTHAPKPYRAIEPNLGFIKTFHEADLIVHAWTINEIWEMHEVLESGAEGFFTDRPMRALAVVEGKNRTEIDTLWKKIEF